MTSMTAAVMYYGSANVTQFRLDLPVLFVRAGLDRPGVNDRSRRWRARDRAERAVDAAELCGGHHGFETVDDTETTRRVIDETIASSTQRRVLPGRVARLARRGRQPPDTSRQKFKEAADEYARMVASRPDDLACGWRPGRRCSVTGSSRRRARSSRSFGTSRWARATGLPAARACL